MICCWVRSRDVGFFEAGDLLEVEVPWFVMVSCLLRSCFSKPSPGDRMDEIRSGTEGATYQVRLPTIVI